MPFHSEKDTNVGKYSMVYEVSLLLDPSASLQVLFVMLAIFILFLFF